MQSVSQKNMMVIYAEIDLYITLIYLLLESQRHQYPSDSSQKFKNELGKVNMWLLMRQDHVFI